MLASLLQLDIRFPSGFIRIAFVLTELPVSAYISRERNSHHVLPLPTDARKMALNCEQFLSTQLYQI
jgi:hypothetical protein